MKTKIYSILICFVVLFTSCEDYLNEQPKGVFIPTEVEHFESLMIQFFSMQGRFAENLMLMSDQVTSDEANIAFGQIHQLRRFVWADFVDETLTESNENWENAYKRIFVYNSIIEEAASGNIAGDAGEISRLVAMARAARAYEYFDLVNMFGKSYDESTAASDLGVPIVTLADVSAPIPERSSVKDIYDYMVAEISEVISDLPTTAYNKTLMPGQDMAYAFLARVYLFMHDYAKAKENVDMALNIKSHIFDINNPYPNVIENPEVIYVKVRHNFVSRIAYNPWYQKGYSLAPEFVNLFEEGDVRLSNLSFSGATDADGNLYLQPNPNATEVNIGLSVPELYLIRAECNARLAGATQLIIDDLNTLRVLRFPPGTYVDLTTDDIADNEAALSFVLDERRRELAFRDMRVFDMRRLMVTGENSETLNRNVLGADYSIAPNANNWIMNIPLKVMDFNPNWEQNPRDGVSIEL